VTLKVRLRPFRTFTRSRTIEAATRQPETVRAVAGRLLADFELDAPVRLLGVGVSGLTATGQQVEGSLTPANQEAMTLDV
jgi:DNA polymerase-4